MAADAQERRGASLIWRVFAGNAALVLVAWALLAFSPATVRPPFALWSGVLGLIGVCALLVVNFVLVRRALAPLSRLTQLMRGFDPLLPGPRIHGYGRDAEIAEVAAAFNDMLARLEQERRESSRRALAAQEAERRRVARELHDGVGQGLTGVLLHIESVERDVSPEIAARLAPARDTARASLEEVRRIARQLRPEALDDLGLRSALLHLVEATDRAMPATVTSSISPDLPELDADVELVIYRIAQEALTNVARHAGASRVDVRLHTTPERVVLQILDDGCGMDRRRRGGGITGMRERALLIAGDLTIVNRPLGGVEVKLLVDAG